MPSVLPPLIRLWCCCGHAFGNRTFRSFPCRCWCKCLELAASLLYIWSKSILLKTQLFFHTGTTISLKFKHSVWTINPVASLLKRSAKEYLLSVHLVGFYDKDVFLLESKLLSGNLYEETFDAETENTRPQLQTMRHQQLH